MLAWVKRFDRNWQARELDQTPVFCFGILSMTGLPFLMASYFRVYWMLFVWYQYIDASINSKLGNFIYSFY